jgi:hypothetical protein
MKQSRRVRYVRREIATSLTLLAMTCFLGYSFCIPVARTIFAYLAICSWRYF